MDLNIVDNRSILHCDMNNFFASVECRINPKIKDLPVAVCGNVEERHGIVLARNNIAKKFGVTVGDAIWKAKSKCNDLYICSNPHFDEYEKYSKLARSIYRRYTDMVESFGIDECWLDITNSLKLFGEPLKIAYEIKETIKKELGLTISVGVSFNKIFAKLGSDYKKPDAVTLISKDNFKEIVWPLDNSMIIGVGRKTKEVLDKYFINTIGDIANETEDRLLYLLGVNGGWLYNAANGINYEPVSCDEEIDLVKSISHGITTVKDIVSFDEAWRVIFELTQEIAMKLRSINRRATVIQVSVRDSKLNWVQFQKKPNMSLQSAIDIAKFAFEILKNRYIFNESIRTLTITASSLIEEGTIEQIGILDDYERKTRIEKLEKCIEDINEKYGEELVKNAGLYDNVILPESRKKIKYESKTYRKN